MWYFMLCILNHFLLPGNVVQFLYSYFQIFMMRYFSGNYLLSFVLSPRMGGYIFQLPESANYLSQWREIGTYMEALLFLFVGMELTWNDWNAFDSPLVQRMFWEWMQLVLSFIFAILHQPQINCSTEATEWTECDAPLQSSLFMPTGTIMFSPCDTCQETWSVRRQKMLLHVIVWLELNCRGIFGKALVVEA